ncbi:MAG: hypothetical protein QGG89_15925, partial [Vicinamibacterales bacterium]|nr:hypothetical protein [Vicinamibacterales bacterium]
MYQRDLAGISQLTLAKVDEDSLKGGSAQAVRIGENGVVGSYGGVRLTPDGALYVAPDIAIGDDDVVHIVYYHPAGNAVRHKSMPAQDWTDLSNFGWDMGDSGASVGTFVDEEATNKGLDMTAVAGNINIAASGAVHLFPTVVVDQAQVPDVVYALWKHTDAGGVTPDGATQTVANDENIAFNTFIYDGSTGPNATWGTRQFAFPQGQDGGRTYQVNGGPLFQNASAYQIQNDGWAYVDRVAAVVDARSKSGVNSDIHIAFTGGGSQSGASPISSGFFGTASGVGVATNLYYSRYNGSEWELPQVTASARHTVSSATELHEDGVQSQHRALFSPALAMVTGDDNVYMTFVGGSPRLAGAEIGERGRRIATGTTVNTPGRGFATLHTADVAPLPYFKVVGRVANYDDVSQPPGGFQYQLTYNPVNPQTSQTHKNLVTVTAAEKDDGSGIGASQPGSSAAPGGFLTGQWRQIGNHSLGVTSLNPGETGATFKGANSQAQASSNSGVWEGKVNDDGSVGFGEWGDDGDKVGLLIKLNVLGSDSGNNLFVIGQSTAARLGGSANAADSSSQNITIADTTQDVMIPLGENFVKAITGTGKTDFTSAPMGSYFWMGANISIRTTNAAPVVQVTEPNASTIGSGAFANATGTIKYVLFDSDDNVNAANTSLQMELYA